MGHTGSCTHVLRTAYVVPLLHGCLHTPLDTLRTRKFPTPYSPIHTHTHPHTTNHPPPTHTPPTHTHTHTFTSTPDTSPLAASAPTAPLYLNRGPAIRRRSHVLSTARCRLGVHGPSVPTPVARDTSKGSYVCRFVCVCLCVWGWGWGGWVGGWVM
jgi:hypothetical protein